MKLGVVGNPRHAEISEILSRVFAIAPSHNLTLYTDPDLVGLWPREVPVLDETQSLDLLVTFGGDGTLLRGAHVLAGRQVPIMGVNVGRVGFLTTAPLEHLEEALETFVEGKYVVESRRALSTTIIDAHGESPADFTLNDVVVHKGGVARVLRFRVTVDDEAVGQYSADGIIVATPTGSTAYSMSAGGPIVVPGVDALAITAICPHTLAVRPIIVPGSAVIRIEQLSPYTDKVLVSYDGQWDVELEPGSTVCVRSADATVQMVRLGTEGFFDRVRSKLQWGDLSDREKV
jgi:NAD+ kinase